MLFEKIQQIIVKDDLRAKKELSDFYAQMEALDKEAILMNGNENNDITETESEKINTISFQSTVNPERHNSKCCHLWRQSFSNKRIRINAIDITI